MVRFFSAYDLPAFNTNENALLLEASYGVSTEFLDVFFLHSHLSVNGDGGKN